VDIKTNGYLSELGNEIEISAITLFDGKEIKIYRH
jgi:hypothetical protein